MRRFIFSYGVAILLLAGIGGWMLSGTFVEGGKGPGNGEQPALEALGLAEPAPAEEDTAEASPDGSEADVAEAAVEEPFLVRVETFTAQQMPQRLPLRGRTQASASVGVRAETSGILESREVNKGDMVNPGDLLCTIDQGTRKARLAQAKATLEQARKDSEANQTLIDRGVASANSGLALEAAFEAAQASVDEAQAELDRTEIRTEIAGVIQSPVAEVGDMLSAGGVCATVVQLDPMLFVGEVSENRVVAIAAGMPAGVRTVTGNEVLGTVKFVSSSANSSTRSFELEIELPNPDGAIRDGVTAEAVIQLGTQTAHFIPQSAITIADDGSLGVRAVDENQQVVFHPIEILGDTTEGLWVSGLPETADVIILGQEFVTAGQTVRVGRAHSEVAES